MTTIWEGMPTEAPRMTEKGPLVSVCCDRCGCLICEAPTPEECGWKMPGLGARFVSSGNENVFGQSTVDVVCRRCTEQGYFEEVYGA